MEDRRVTFTVPTGRYAELSRLRTAVVFPSSSRTQIEQVPDYQEKSGQYARAGPDQMCCIVMLGSFSVMLVSVFGLFAAFCVMLVGLFLGMMRFGAVCVMCVSSMVFFIFCIVMLIGRFVVVLAVLLDP